MKSLLIFLSLTLQVQKTKCQTISITEFSKVSFINPYDTTEKKKRIDLALLCNDFITKYYPNNKHIVYLMFNKTYDSSKYNICFDNLFGNSLDEDNESRASKYYKPGLRIEINYDSVAILKLLDYGLSNIPKIYKKREKLIAKKSLDTECLRLSKSTIEIILKKPLHKRLRK